MGDEHTREQTAEQITREDAEHDKMFEDILDEVSNEGWLGFQLALRQPQIWALLELVLLSTM